MHTSSQSRFTIHPGAPLILRLGLAACFVGHGAFGLLQKQEWLGYFQLLSVPEPLALRVMPLIGTIDITIGLLALLAPCRALFAYAAVWSLLTAALRPLAGEGIAELVERAGNYGVPIALLLLAGRGAWLSRFTDEQHSATRQRYFFSACQWTTALLLAGHGVLALQGKPLLQQHLASAGIPLQLTAPMGALEIGAAALVLLTPGARLFGAVALWKLTTEALFLVDGAPVFEFIERGGSYAAPVAALLLQRMAPAARRSYATVSHAGARSALIASIIGVLPASVYAQAAPQPSLSQPVLESLRAGGLVIACRHAITNHDQQDRSPIDYDDPGTQRVLSADGEAQARKLGQDLIALGIQFDDIRASPFQRTRRTAELMFSRVTIDTVLSSRARNNDAQLRALVTTPEAGPMNRLLITHQGILYRMLRTLKEGSVDEGSCVVVRPLGDSFELLALVRPRDWLAAR